jgi:hypothetical protein
MYAIVVSVLVLVLLERMLMVFEYAERAAVETTILRTQSALHTRLAYDLLRGKAPDLDAWSAHNPFELAKMKPENFAGERDAPDTGTLEGGKWVYDRATRQLIYFPRYSRGLSIEGGGAALRYHLSLGGPGGLPRLVPVAPYRWEP